MLSPQTLQKLVTQRQLDFTQSFRFIFIKVPGGSATKLYYVLCIPHRMPSVDIIKILHSWVACETD